MKQKNEGAFKKLLFTFLCINQETHRKNNKKVSERILFMLTLNGKGVFGGIAIGKITVLEEKKQVIKRYKIDDCEEEIKRVNDACDVAKEQLLKLYKNAVLEVGESNAEIFNIHRMMIDDSDYRESIENIIESESVNAEYAVAVTGDNFCEMFSSMDDEYMKERANDVRDITNKIVSILSDSNTDLKFEEPTIIFADDLLPSQTVRFDKSKILAFITKKGSINSHTAILARTMNIPAVVGIGEYDLDINSETVIVDGFEGKVYVNPTQSVMEEMQKKKESDESNKKLLLKLKGKPSVTLDGKKINIFANFGGLKDVADVLINDADGIGLFRSEFLYLDKDTYPTEEEQFLVYKTVAQNMAGKKVIIRTLDIGADKHIDYFGIEKEENPALGFRAIRICLERKEVFKTQLRAILRASAFGNISLMIPMIVSKEEVLEVKKIIREVKRELDNDDILYKHDIEFGIMIETPAAVMISDILAYEVDFFSIGTNDLAQYTLACDRQNPKVEHLLEKTHEAVLRMIEITARSAKKAGIWVGICGEMAADISLCEFFLSIGIDELSVSPANVLSLRKKVRTTDTRMLD